MSSNPTAKRFKFMAIGCLVAICWLGFVSFEIAHSARSFSSSVSSKPSPYNQSLKGIEKELDQRLVSLDLPGLGEQVTIVQVCKFGSRDKEYYALLKFETEAAREEYIAAAQNQHATYLKAQEFDLGPPTPVIFTNDTSYLPFVQSVLAGCTGKIHKVNLIEGRGAFTLYWIRRTDSRELFIYLYKG